ncbi:Substrate-binding region of ABC-type glycine betaine transport system [Xylanimonas cellulosilytica DSM 15894]|uniref:Substrate-binding region of ABC-type glycine betaine transport system n=1 Tax=Xylanimonas cellulosilytica (strain DSM 15894 / JCM 12276 / CECT 5975 / KCTC 9989 / LMG 20990 / NBRC 107835 / XIL07) TaxID=446471 RepID=D1BWK1_XYLCX|nr:glycine betaine ABC transporter substrate-binding protein [Xylanimonas cellulosilytica]ACZ31546.1 Substrate-binding region of ABC-type glycine betaine transport system [Xylanimonas cellulosilytica DSM 15894]
MTPARKHLSRTTSAVAATAALGLALTACASGSDAGSASDVAMNGTDEAVVSIGVASGWDEGIAVSHLWTTILEAEGYEVESQTADVGIIYTGLAGGDFDITFDVWLPYTHASYEKKYGAEITDLGYWYDDAKLTIAVNEDSPAQSLEDLAAMAGEYGNKLVGIEAGAGLTEITQDQVIPTYGLEDMDYSISSTPAMLAELKGATAAGENIAVTLWRPHWAYDEFPVRDLEDPEGSLGEAEEVHIWGALDFEERYPTLTKLVGAFALDDEQLFSLENMLFNSDEYADEDAAVDAWLEQNPTFVDDLKAAAGI